MMIITLCPVGGPAPVALEKQGDAVICDGVRYDFAPLPNGATLPASAVSGGWLADGSVVRRDLEGTLHLTAKLPHGPNAPEETRFPQPIIVSQDGPIALPPFDLAPEGDLPGDMIGEFDE